MNHRLRNPTDREISRICFFYPRRWWGLSRKSPGIIEYYNNDTRKAYWLRKAWSKLESLEEAKCSKTPWLQPGASLSAKYQRAVSTPSRHSRYPRPSSAAYGAQVTVNQPSPRLKPWGLIYCASMRRSPSLSGASNASGGLSLAGWGKEKAALGAASVNV